MANIKLIDRGSRKHLLDLVESNPVRNLNRLIERSGFKLCRQPQLHPYGRQDDEAWKELEVEDYLNAWAEENPEIPTIAHNWWLAYPGRNRRRPTWDLIGKLRTEGDHPGILLVEAKAHVSELCSRDRMSPSNGSPEGNANERRILKRIEETQRILNRQNRTKKRLPVDTHYQLVNRLAYACYLASIGFHVVLLYLGFCQDTYFERDPILDQRHWERVMGGYLQGVVSQAFPETRHNLGDGSLQMLIEASDIQSVSVLR